LNRSGIAAYQPEDCILNLSVSGVGRLLWRGQIDIL
jgi:hypothetical protein